MMDEFKTQNLKVKSTGQKSKVFIFLFLPFIFTFLLFTFAFAAPQRIISTMPSNTEILFALGLGDRVVGVTDSCNYPEEAKLKEKIGGVILNMEKIVSLKPDLIAMLQDAQGMEIEKLKRLDLPVFTVNPHTIDEVMESILLIGEATGVKVRAQKLVNNMEDRIDQIVNKLPTDRKPKVFVEVWHDPLITAGKGTVIHDLIGLSGGENIAASAPGPYPEFSLEKLIAEDPDYIIIPKQNVKNSEVIYNDIRWRNLEAVKEERILFIEGDLISRPGPRLVEALEKIAEFIYP